MSVGLKLANEIQDPMSSEDWNDNLTERNPNSIFFTSTHICNLSFKKNVKFPNKMKIAKVVPL